MKKFYSILALALAMSCEMSAQGVYYKAPANATIAQINAAVTDETSDIDVTEVASIDVSLIKRSNPNTLILCKHAQCKTDAQKNIVNLVRVDREGAVYGGGIARNFVIDDRYPFYSKHVFDAQKASYKRNVTNEYNTVCIPFCFIYEDQRDDLHFEVLKSVSPDLLVFDRVDGGEYDNVVEGGVHHIAGGTPLVVHLHEFEPGKVNTIEIINETGCSVNANEDKVYEDLAYTLSGDYVDRTIEAGDATRGYIQDNRFWTGADFDATVRVPAYRCILTEFSVSKGSKAVKFAESTDVTAIKSISANSNAAAYNLQGVRVAADAKGFVVVDGKKYFNK